MSDDITQKDILVGSAGWSHLDSGPSPEMQIQSSYKLNNKLENILKQQKGE
ncbi:MAG TPA: hypothetical protein VMT42_03665 [candidate division Zixibacteria bacterium]|nr:hypothetical protein [candidate division Zixibacteria bacterium]